MTEYNPKPRTCFICEKPLFVNDFAGLNINTYDLLELESLWESEYIQLTCCFCNGLIKSIELLGEDKLRGYLNLCKYWEEPHVKNLKRMGVIE